MKKIIAAFDSLGFSESTLQYAVFLAKEYDAHLMGVFLRESTRIGHAVYATITKQSDSGKSIFNAIENADKETMHKAIMELSMLFHRSLADLLLRQTNAPVFIAHL